MEAVSVRAERAVSFAQQRLWFLDQLRPDSVDYLLPLVVRLSGQLDVDALTAALAGVVRRHDVLRTRYPAADGEPVAVVEADVPVAPELVDLTATPGLTETEPVDELVDELVERELRRPVDLATGPPWRATLARLADDEHLLILVVHHIAFDFASWSILGRELAAGYRELTGGGPADLPPLTTQYAEFARRQRDRLDDGRLDRHLDYWRRRLAGLGPLELPTDRPRPPVWVGTGAVTRFVIPPDLLAAVDGFARANRSTRFQVLLAAFQALLSRYTGATDVAVGTPVSGRNRVEVENLVGLFVNTVVLRTDLSDGPGFAALLRRVRDDALTAFAHAEVPFERIVTELTPRRDLSRNPLFQVSFALLHTPEEPVTLPGLDCAMRSTPVPGTPFDLVLDLVRRPDGQLAGRLAYAAELFDPETMTRLGDGYVRLLRILLADPDTPVGRLAQQVGRLPGRQRRRLLAQGNDTDAPLPDLTVTDLFTRQAAATPDAPAVLCGTHRLDYRALDAGSNRLAHYLRGLGVGPGSLVGVLLDRGIDLPVAFLGVLKSGAAYVPLDPGYPDRRIDYMLRDSGAETLLTGSAFTDRAGRFGGVRHTVVLDRDRAAVAACPGTGLGAVAGRDDLAYVIYTSGSTGTPKGVQIDHRALTAFLVSMMDRPGLRPGVPVMALTTVSFDPSVLELYLPLLAGAHLVMAAAQDAVDPQRLAALITETAPALLQATPVVLRMLLDTGWSAPAGLTVLCGGEKVTAELGRRLAGQGAVVWDVYGPTEATVWATAARLAPDGQVAAWAPRANCRLYLLDDRMEPVPDGTTGEIYLGGTGLAWGYRGKPALTAGRFVPDPHTTTAGGRLYRTGDLGRRRPDGSVEILGRIDHQVKIRGHRIEPGEIEAALCTHPDIRTAVVHPVPAHTGEPRLVAYVVPRGDPQAIACTDELRRFVCRTLPGYMAPAAVVVLDELPRTANGKVDRLALPVPEDTPAPSRTADDQPPRTPYEQTVAEVWREVLGTGPVGVHENFFDIGGHSLLATRVSIRLRAALGIDVPVRALFDHSSVAALAAALPDYPRTAAQRATPKLRTYHRAGRVAQ